jgi:hypothetical protein
MMGDNSGKTVTKIPQSCLAFIFEFLISMPIREREREREILIYLFLIQQSFQSLTDKEGK